MSSHPSELELHGHLIGALGDEHAARVKTHATACDRCRDALGALEQAHGEFRTSVFPRTHAGVEERAASAGRRAFLRWVYVLAPATAAALIVLRLASTPTPADDDLLAKGGGPVLPALDLFVRRGGEVFRAGAASRLRAGDEVRFVVHRPQELGHVMIVSADGAGAANLYLPYGGQQSAAISTAGPRAELPGSIVLDASRGPERLFALFSSTPLAWSDVERALQALARGGAEALRREERLPVAAGAQATVLFEKDAAP